MNAQTPIAAPETKGALPDLENKAVRPEGGPVRSALDELAAAFAAFKETNDARLGQIEGRLGVDVVTEEKLARSTPPSTPPAPASTGSPWSRPGRRWGRPRRGRTRPRRSTNPPSTSMSGRARAPASSAWRPRPSRPAPGPTAATSCPTRSSGPC